MNGSEGKPGTMKPHRFFDFTKNPPAYPFWTKYVMMLRSSLRILFARKWICRFRA
jgi:hypothetical protein